MKHAKPLAEVLTAPHIDYLIVVVATNGLTGTLLAERPVGITE
jgi:hypothetical protein